VADKMIRVRSIHAWRRALLAGVLSASALPAFAQVVVLTHPDSGDFVVVQNRPAPRAEAMRRANAKGRQGGWQQQLVSMVPGYGAMFCFRPKGGQMRYFPVEGKATDTEAVSKARAQANAAARGSGAVTFICGTWNNRNAHPLDVAVPSPDAPSPIPTPASRNGPGGEAPRREGEGGLIQTLREQVRERVTCDEKAPKKEGCPPPPKRPSAGVRG
jgi:hypothetical protein